MNEDRSRSLLARLMLRYSLLHTQHGEQLLYEWRRNEYNKPFIPGWYEFSISHAGEWVLFAYSDERIGVDVELCADMDYEQLYVCFHRQEQLYIRTAVNPQQAFYNIWVKKEAILKATGTGITNGLDTFSCVENAVIYGDVEWTFYSLALTQEYIAYLCSSKAGQHITLTELSIASLISNNHFPGH